MLFSCDLLENSYLCGINNNTRIRYTRAQEVVICLKIRTFVVSTTTFQVTGICIRSCDLLENSYLCGINNNNRRTRLRANSVVICLKIRTFVVSTTTSFFVERTPPGCDLLENSYLCGINNNCASASDLSSSVVICLKIRTFVVSTTTNHLYKNTSNQVVICLKIRTFVVSTTTSGFK